jgi:hypothetical protein
MSTCAFELDRFTAGDERLEVSGRWMGVRGRRFVRPSLTVFIDGHSTRALAELEHKPWAAEDGDEWVAAFPWHGRLDEIEEFELAVAPDLLVRLPPPDGTIREVVLPVVAPDDQAEPAPVERAPEPPRGDARELREQADAVRHNALAVRDRALADLDEAVAARDRLRAELERAVADRGRVSAELDQLAGEHDRLKSERRALQTELGRVRAELRMAHSDLALARRPQSPEPPPVPKPEPPPLAPPMPIVPLPPPRAQLHRSQSWSIRALVIVLMIAAAIALVIVLTSGPSSVAP